MYKEHSYIIKYSLINTSDGKDTTKTTIFP